VKHVAEGVVVDSTMRPGERLSLRGPKGQGHHDHIGVHVKDAGFAVGDRIAVVPVSAFVRLVDFARKATREHGAAAYVRNNSDEIRALLRDTEWL